MAFINPDVDVYLLRFLIPKTFLLFGMVNKYCLCLIRSDCIYNELVRLKFDKRLYRFCSYDIIKQYYKHGMINLIIRDKLDYYRVVKLAATYGHLDLLQHIAENQIYYPLASYSLRHIDSVYKALITASKNNHHHILKWFAHHHIIDRWFGPSKIYATDISYFEQIEISQYIIKYAVETNDIVFLQDLKRQCDFSVHLWWEYLLSHSFEYGHLTLCDWILDMAQTESVTDVNNVYLNLPFDLDPEKKLITQMLKWLEQNRYKLPRIVYLNNRNSYLLGYMDIIDHVYDSTNLPNYTPFLIEKAVYDAVYNPPVPEQGNLDVVKLIYSKTEYKEYIDRHTSIVLKWIIKSNNLPLLVWLTNTINNIAYTAEIISEAIINGQIQILEWFWSQQIKIDYDEDTIFTVSSTGRCHILDWLKTHQLLPSEMTKSIIQGAVFKGQLHILTWLGEHSIKEVLTSIRIRIDTINTAIAHGRLEVLKLFHQYDIIKEVSSLIFHEPHAYRDIYSTVYWLKTHYDNFDLLRLFTWAVEDNQWHIVTWILQSYSETYDMFGLTDDLEEKLQQYLAFAKPSTT